MNKKYISMAEAAKLSPYTQEYLSLMARRGLIRAKKIGRNWYTNVDAINEHIKQIKPEEMAINIQNNNRLEKQEKIKAIRTKYPNFRLALIYTSLVLIVAFLVYSQVSNKSERKISEKQNIPPVSKEITESSNSVVPYFTRGEKVQF
jgi:predicted HAD superfamily phosphohydrolase